MKVLYITIMTICVLFLIIIYFTNIMYLGTQTMFFWSQNSRISVEIWLLLIIVVAFILWFSAFGLMTKLVNRKPKDFDEFDI